jgi:hypothetical protein
MVVFLLSLAKAVAGLAWLEVLTPEPIAPLNRSGIAKLSSLMPES